MKNSALTFQGIDPSRPEFFALKVKAKALKSNLKAELRPRFSIKALHYGLVLGDRECLYSSHGRIVKK